MIAPRGGRFPAGGKSTRHHLHPQRTRTWAHSDRDNPYVLVWREGESGTVRMVLDEVRYLADALASMAAEIAEVVSESDDCADTVDT